MYNISSSDADFNTKETYAAHCCSDQNRLRFSQPDHGVLVKYQGGQVWVLNLYIPLNMHKKTCIIIYEFIYLGLIFCGKHKKDLNKVLVNLLFFLYDFLIFYFKVIFL